MKIAVYKTYPTESEKAHGLVPTHKELVFQGKVTQSFPNMKRYGYELEGGIPDDAQIYSLEGGVVIIWTTI